MRRVFLSVLVVLLFLAPAAPAATQERGFVAADHVSALGRPMMEAHTHAADLARCVAGPYQSSPPHLGPMMSTALPCVPARPTIDDPAPPGAR